MEMQHEESDSYDGEDDGPISLHQLEEELLMEESNEDDDCQDEFHFQSEEDTVEIYILEHQEIGQTVDVSTDGYIVEEVDEEPPIISLEETVIENHQVDPETFEFYNEQHLELVNEHEEQDPDHALVPVERELRRVVLKHVEEVIEEVIQTHSATVTEEELVNQQRLRMEAESTRRERTRNKDPLSLPFQYAGQSFNVQSQKLILNTIHFLKKHHKDSLLDSVKSPQEKAAKVLNISTSVIAKIRKNWDEGILEQPGRKRKMKKRILDSISEADEMVLRSIIKQISSTGETPQIPTLLSEARARVNFVGSRTSFRRILKRMGFYYAKVDKKLVLIDNSAGKTSQPKMKTERTRTFENILAPGKVKIVKRPGQRETLEKGSQQSSKVKAEPRIRNKRVRLLEAGEGKPRHHHGQSPEIPALVPVQPTTSSSFPSSNINQTDESAARLQPGEFVFEVDGQNLCFRIVSADEALEA